MKHRHKHIKHKIKHFKPKKSLFSRPIFWVILLCLLLIGTAVYFMFFFPKFQVTTITVSGNQKVNGNLVQTASWKDIQQNILGFNSKNIFMINTASLQQSLLTEFATIENVSVQKQGLQTLDVKLTERSPVAVFCPNQTTSDCFSIDKNGVIYEKVPTPNSSDLVVTKYVGQPDLVEGKTIIDKTIIDAIVKIKDVLKNNFQVDVKQVLASNPLVVTTTEGWGIYFDPDTDINLQIIKLNALLKDQISTDARKNLQYIYLQYKDRAYYK